MARDLLHADHHFDGQRRSWRRFNDKICVHLSGLICKQGMTCYGVISGEPQNAGGNANAVVASRLWRREVAWNVLNDVVDDTSLRGYLRSTFGSGLNAVAGGAGGVPRTVDPLGAWRHLLATVDAPLNQMEISEAKMEWQMVEIATHVDSSVRTVQNLHNLLYSINYKMPLVHRHTEEEMASKILMCMSKFDTYLREKCHDIINGEPG